jgi:hypothetical protein
MTSKSQPVSGPISDRIRPGDIHAQTLVDRAEERPSADSVRHGSGQGLGAGATRERSGR